MGEDRVKRDNRMIVLASVQGHESTVAHAFNSTGGRCPKCGCDQCLLMFCAPSSRPLPALRGCELEGEHLHRMCGACHYPWIERCLDRALLSQEKGELTAESELAAALASVAHHAGGIAIPRHTIDSYRGWTLKFHREEGTLCITAEPSTPDSGTPTHPDPPNQPHQPA